MPVTKVIRNSKKAFFGGMGAVIPYRRKVSLPIAQDSTKQGLVENIDRGNDSK